MRSEICYSKNENKKIIMTRGAYCFVKTCNTNKFDYPSLSFMHLPKDPSIAKKWVEFADRSDVLKDELYKKKTYSICSNHFSEKDFKSVYPRRLLWPKSIPSLNGPKCMPSSQRDASLANNYSATNITDLQPRIKRKAVDYISIEKARSSSVCEDVAESSRNVCNDNNTTDLQPSIKRKVVKYTSIEKA